MFVLLSKRRLCLLTVHTQVLLGASGHFHDLADTCRFGSATVYSNFADGLRSRDVNTEGLWKIIFRVKECRFR